MQAQPVVVVSNRGPVSFHRTADDALVASRGAGGLVSGLSPLLRVPGRLWVAAALSDDDRAAVLIDPDHRRGPSSDVPYCSVEVDGIHTVLGALDPEDLRLSYETVCNATLWYLHHHLFDLTYAPVFDRGWFAAWDAYRRSNGAFADLVAAVAPPRSTVLVQDYHLALLGPLLARQRDDLRLVHFSHTPFAEPHVLAVLPDAVRRELLEGMAGHGACGFHTDAWRAAFLACCAADGVEPPATFVAPLGPDAADLAATTSSAAFIEASEGLDSHLGDRLLIARSDRIELSKNLIRGFVAFDILLDTEPQWRERVVFAASVYPSRESNPDYVAYREQMEATVARINERWSAPGWTPILLDTGDHFPTSMATLARADVVMVNPIRDGLNLVAKEAMLVNRRDALLALSASAGAWDEMAAGAAEVHPYDVTQTAKVLHDLLSTNSAARGERAAVLRVAAAARTPADWLDDQLTASR